MFQITFRADVAAKIRRLSELAGMNPSAKLFWNAMARHVESIANDAGELGEPKYDFKFVKMRSRLVVREYIAVQYAMSEERQFVLVQKLSLSGRHPYPTEYEDVLNSNKT